MQAPHTGPQLKRLVRLSAAPTREINPAMPLKAPVSARVLSFMLILLHARGMPPAPMKPIFVYPGPPKGPCCLCWAKTGLPLQASPQNTSQTPGGRVKRTAPRTAAGSGAPKPVPAGHAQGAPAAAAPLSLQAQRHSHPGSWALCRMPNPLTSHTSPHGSTALQQGPPRWCATPPGAQRPTHVSSHPSCSHTHYGTHVASGAQPRAPSTNRSACSRKVRRSAAGGQAPAAQRAAVTLAFARQGRLRGACGRAGAAPSRPGAPSRAGRARAAQPRPACAWSSQRAVPSAMRAAGGGAPVRHRSIADLGTSRTGQC